MGFQIEQVYLILSISGSDNMSSPKPYSFWKYSEYAGEEILPFGENDDNSIVLYTRFSKSFHPFSFNSFNKETIVYFIFQEESRCQQKAVKCGSWLAVGGYEAATFTSKDHEPIRLVTAGNLICTGNRLAEPLSITKRKFD